MDVGSWVMSQHKKQLGYLIFSIGIMTVAQFPAGIYLPAMTQMGHYFGVAHGKIQYVLGIYLFTYGASQLIYGPLSDHYGRKPVVTIGLICFMLGSIICAFSKIINMMYLGALIQGVGLGSVAVVSTAILRDIHGDLKLLSWNSYKSSATIITPLIAPIIGSYLTVHIGWQATFIFLLIYSAVIFLLFLKLFKETKLSSTKNHLNLKYALLSYKDVVKTNNFWQASLCRILAISGGTAYAANSPFIFQSLLHLTPIQYAWVSVIPAFGFFTGTLLAKKLGNHHTIEKIIQLGAVLLLTGSLLLLIFGYIHLTILSVIIPMLIYMCGSGILFPSTLTKAMLPLGALAGTGAALIGSIQNLGRGFFSGFVGYFHAYNILPLAITLVCIANCVMMVCLISMRHELTKIRRI